MRLLVCGGRNFLNANLIAGWMASLLKSGDVVIHGAARGADSIAGSIAVEMGLDVRAYPADWEREGRAAGVLRNQRMLDAEKPDLVLAFPGNGKGTWDMIRRAQKAGVKVIIGNSPDVSPGSVPRPQEDPRG